MAKVPNGDMGDITPSLAQGAHQLAFLSVLSFIGKMEVVSSSRDI